MSLSLYIIDLQHNLKVEGDDDPKKHKDDKLQHLFYADDLQIYLRVDINQLERGVAALPYENFMHKIMHEFMHNFMHKIYLKKRSQKIHA